MKQPAKLIRISIGTVVLMAAIVAPIGGLNSSGALDRMMKRGDVLSPRQTSAQSSVSTTDAVRVALQKQKVTRDDLTTRDNENHRLPAVTVMARPSSSAQKIVTPVRYDKFARGGERSATGGILNAGNGGMSGSNYGSWRNNAPPSRRHHGGNGYLPGNPGDAGNGNGGTVVNPIGGDGTTAGQGDLPGNNVVVPVPSAVILGLAGLLCLSRLRKGIMRTC
jgi:hypothetical protein